MLQCKQVLPRIHITLDMCFTPQLFCCRSYKKVFNTAIQDLMREDEANEMYSASHADDLQAELQSGIKEKLLQQ